MPDEAITRWKQRGAIHLWNYPDTRPGEGLSGWNFSADADGATSLGELIDLFRESLYPNRRRIAIAPFANDRYFRLDNARFASDLTLVCPSGAAPDFWQLILEGEGVSLTLGRG